MDNRYKNIVIKEWLKKQEYQYYDKDTDDFDSICLDGDFNLIELLEMFEGHVK